MSIETSIKRLTRIITDKNCRKMNLSNIKGYLGELIVFNKLTKREPVSSTKKGIKLGMIYKYLVRTSRLMLSSPQSRRK